MLRTSCSGLAATSHAKSFVRFIAKPAHGSGAKATGVPLAKVASLVMSGKTLAELGIISEAIPRHIAVKEAVLPFQKFHGALSRKTLRQKDIGSYCP